MDRYKDHRAEDRCWYENSLSYSNAVLPYALLLCGQWIPNKLVVETRLESLRWLCDVQHSVPLGGHFVPIGSNGFYRRGGERARFDQQPLEAQVTVSACLEAYRDWRQKLAHGSKLRF